MFVRPSSVSLNSKREVKVRKGLDARKMRIREAEGKYDDDDDKLYKKNSAARGHEVMFDFRFQSAFLKLTVLHV